MARISINFWGILVMCLCWAVVMAEAEYKKYKDPTQPINVRIKDLMSRMTLEEKNGQMTQIDRTVASGQVINKYLLGSVLSGGRSVPAANASAETWIDMVNGFQVGALNTRLGIPIIYGIDALHGHNNVYKATISPHNVGLGATCSGTPRRRASKAAQPPFYVMSRKGYPQSKTLFFFHHSPAV